ncbi:flavin reductase family protein [Humidisolicoccus flavus]|uniref:flavin reductase family protein n=1 Tax=Humidisolicoccus flavus TaxID=3111414 RepID=UPI0032502ED1
MSTSGAARPQEQPQDDNSEPLIAAEAARKSFDDLDSTSFRKAFRNHPSGVALITADDGNGPVALTASSVFSVSLEPPLLVFSLSTISSSAPTIREADTVIVHLLDSEHLDLAKLGATSGIDRFADTEAWHRLETGEPLFHGVENWIRGRIINRLDAGGSTVVVVHAIESGDSGLDSEEQKQPLVYHNRTWHELGDHSRITE